MRPLNSEKSRSCNASVLAIVRAVASFCASSQERTRGARRLGSRITCAQFSSLSHA